MNLNLKKLGESLLGLIAIVISIGIVFYFGIIPYIDNHLPPHPSEKTSEPVRGYEPLIRQ